MLSWAFEVLPNRIIEHVKTQANKKVGKSFFSTISRSSSNRVDRCFWFLTYELHSLKTQDMWFQTEKEGIQIAMLLMQMDHDLATM